MRRWTEIACFNPVTGIEEVGRFQFEGETIPELMRSLIIQAKDRHANMNQIQIQALLLELLVEFAEDIQRRAQPDPGDDHG